MKGGADVLLNARGLAYSCAEVTGESRVSIRYNAFGKSEPWEEVFEIKLGYALSINCLLAWNELGRFGTPLINNGEDGIVFV